MVMGTSVFTRWDITMGRHLPWQCMHYVVQSFTCPSTDALSRMCCQGVRVVDMRDHMKINEFENEIINEEKKSQIKESIIPCDEYLGWMVVD